jgi:hypothetical protein
MYSDSMVESAVLDCSLLTHTIGVVHRRIIIKPVLDLTDFGSSESNDVNIPAKSASA